MRSVEDFEAGNIEIEVRTYVDDVTAPRVTTREALQNFTKEDLVDTVVQQAVENHATYSQINALCQVAANLYDEIHVLQGETEAPTLATPSRAPRAFTFRSPFKGLRASRQTPPPMPIATSPALRQSTEATGRPTPLTEGRPSVKWPDVEKLDDGKNLTFDAWKRQIEAKLRENADHFRTPTAQASYVQTRVTG